MASNGFQSPAHHLMARIVTLLFLLVPCGGASAQQSILNRGDAAVTAFSGSKTDADVPKGAHPLDVSYIDADGAAMQVYDLSKLGGPPSGKLVDVPATLKIKASEIGQVFGITLDSAEAGKSPNIYAAATSLFGLQIVGTKDGKTVRLAAGELGAKWMAGQFGTDNGGGPGSIWKVDGATGKASLFANVMSGPNPNAGAGLGALAFDPLSKNLYAVNVETGFVHRINLTGKDTAYFDHGTKGRVKAGLEAVAYDPSKRMDIENPSFKVEDPSTWGFTDKKRLVFALAVEGGRLYYSIAEGPQIWSVGLDKDGGFLDDARREIEVSGTPSSGLVTAIMFDGPGSVFITQRGDTAGSYEYARFAKPQSSVVRRYTWNETDKTWSEAFDEYAVGLKAPHRSTNGGLALGYGYDSAGAIDFDACRETVWTTGEHLMDGAGIEARTIHGLQAILKSSAQSMDARKPRSATEALYARGNGDPADTLEAPKTAWFADTDGKYDDGKASGHIGAIAILAPCDKQVAEAARPEPIPESGYPSYPEYAYPSDPGYPDGAPDLGFPTPWPPVSPSISITKTCTPAPVGTNAINCTITVTNTGTVPLTDPIVFTDSTLGLKAGPGGGTPVAGPPINVTSVSPDVAAWTCTPVPTLNMSCGLPANELPPGTSHSVTVTVDSSNFIADGIVGFQNCASLGAPYWGEACADGGMDITVTKTAQSGCTAGNDCDFTITLANNGSLPFSGSIKVGDIMFVNGVSVTPAFTASPGLGCAPVPPTLDFNCTTSLSLAPGAQQSFVMTVQMPAVPNDYWAFNCFGISDPGTNLQLPPSVEAGGGMIGSGGAVSCTWVQVGTPPPLNNLTITKSPRIDPATGLSCSTSPSNASLVRCEFTVAIENDGPAPFPGGPGSVTFTETLPSATAQLANDAELGCGPLGAGSYSCTPPNVPAPIPVHGSYEMSYSVEIPKAEIEPPAAANCRVPNTVTITSPLPGSPTNYIAGDDTATVDADAWHLETTVGGSVEVLCDPTNLVVTKKSKGDCEKSGDGYKCAFTVTVTNEGKDPHTGDIKIVDELNGLSATRITHTTASPWQCTEGSRLKCSIPKGPAGSEWPTLAKGDSYSVDVTVEIPGGKQCSVTNAARLTYPHANTRWNLKSEDDKAEATSMVPDPKCKKPAACTPGEGEFRTVSGDCACKEGFSRNNGGRCVPIEVAKVEPAEPEQQVDAKRCPDGYPIPRSGKCPCETGTWNSQTNRCEEATASPVDPVPPPPAPRCPDGRPKPADGDCTMCAPDQYKAARGVCCNLGQTYDGRRCVSQSTTTPPVPTCDAKCQCEQRKGRWTGRKCVSEPDPPPSYVCWNGKRVSDKTSCPPEPCGKGFTGYKPNCKPIPPPMKTCWNGKQVPVTSSCPPEPCGKGFTGYKPNCKRIPPPMKTCWNGKQVPVTSSCPPEPCGKGFTGYKPNCKPIPPPMKTCWNGKQVPVTSSCPPEPCGRGFTGYKPNCKPVPVRCPKGWIGTYQPNCKPPPPKTYSCWNGQKVTNLKFCPPRPQPCPKGWIGTFQPNCKPPIKPTPRGGTGCPAGQYFSPKIKRCVPLI